jgi:hypothetical protein
MVLIMILGYSLLILIVYLKNITGCGIIAAEMFIGILD